MSEGEAPVEQNGVDLKIISLILFSVTCGVAGQVFFKSGMREVGPLEFGPHVVLHFFRPKIITGICCYAIATSSWLVILSKIPLSLAYPLISVSYVVIVLLGRFVFNEIVTIYTWGGVFLICCGVGLIGFGNQSTRPATPLATPTASSVTPAATESVH